MTGELGRSCLRRPLAALRTIFNLKIETIETIVDSKKEIAWTSENNNEKEDATKTLFLIS